MDDKLLQKVRDQGLHLTSLKEKILEIFEQADTPLSVPDLTSYLKRRRLQPHKTSLYRALQGLTEAEILEEVKLLDGLQTFELKEQKHHHHFVCRECNEVYDFENKEIEELLKNVTKSLERKGHQPDEHSLNLYGLCADCTV